MSSVGDAAALAKQIFEFLPFRHYQLCHQLCLCPFFRARMTQNVVGSIPASAPLVPWYTLQSLFLLVSFFPQWFQNSMAGEHPADRKFKFVTLSV